MPCPLVIGMNPSPRYPGSSWHPDADSTKILAEFAIGDQDMACYLDYGLELDNLNPTIPALVRGRIVVDEEVARARLDSWAEQDRLHDRLIVLFGDDVAAIFTSWAGCEEIPCDGRPYLRTSPRLPSAELRLAKMPHPSRILRLRRTASKDLEDAETRLRSLSEIYTEGEATIHTEWLDTERQIMEEDERAIATLIVFEQNELLRLEEEADAHENWLEARRQWRLDRHEEYDNSNEDDE